VSAGDARPEHIVLSTRYDSTEPLVAALWRQDPDGLTPISITDVSPEDGGFVRVELELPTPDTYYLYAFCQKLDQELVSRSPIGRFLAPPAHDTLRPVRMGASCCAYNLLPPLTLGHAAQRDDLEFFCFLGDTSYNDGCYTIEQYRESWASNLGKRQFIELRQSTSIIATWDDHEIANDWDPESVTLEQYQTAHQAFTEAIPMLRSEESPGRLWRKFRWGRTLEVYALDTRSERTPSRRDDPDGEYLSREQMDWLKTGLAESECRFKLILNSVPIGAYPPIFDVAVGDRWEGYPHQREEILRFIEDEPIGGVLWLAGDFHMAAAGRVSPEGPGSQTIEILAGPAAQVGNVLAWTLPVRDQFDWASSRNNYASLDFDPESGEVHVIFHGLTPFGNEEVLHEERYQIA
jgi:alkaline phosphatase D